MDKLEQSETEFIFYKGESGTTKVGIILGSETVWTTQRGMTEIFNVEVPAISKHIRNIYDTGELSEGATVSKMEIVQTEGDRRVKRSVDMYNLDVIIAVGYRVSSYEATQFRIWATKVLKEYMVKGFALDDERLKQGKNLFDKDYFDELLERIREIRSSERRFYQKITDLYATAIDYDSKSSITQEFYASVQNKLHWAIHHHTAAELIAERADSSKPNMGLTTWKQSGTKGKIVKTDVNVAKNYLTKEEITELNRIVSMYLDFAENMAKRGKPMKMVDWVERLDAFLEFNEYDVLKDAGKISKKAAKKIADTEFSKFRVFQDREYISDFDRVVDEIKTSGKLPPTEEKEELSDFNKKLKRGLNYNPKGNE